MNQDVFIEDAGMDWDDLGGGVRRKIMAYDDRVMLVKVAFEAGSIGTIHQHPHTQISHIREGVFEVEIGGKKQVLKAGDAFLHRQIQITGYAASKKVCWWMYSAQCEKILSKLKKC
ncbi:cupin domain-containing protein [Chitinophaga sedimenti]|uniref:cupin domain-containing protein n=1 Tax=Chitinophaga sedimenti TaxID=2033606 RepID=UPI0020068812|nr:cupin domain-containing protein [Chitinophaga sedimenti]MCK7557302.1 cupin domain-containing protein [Chitinophaga sedimenti]